ncbi:MAG: dihydropteroate synthase [Gemmatimonadota bacterium]|nr:MAG: dihydropteroate synthase [Gemmatimonadota bacterium]
MNLTLLASRRPAAVRDALVRRGMNESRAIAAAQGLDPVAIVLDGLTAGELDAIAAAGLQQGIECIAGGDWILLAGSTSGLASVTRSGSESVPVAILHAIAGCIHAMVEQPDYWATERGRVDLTRPVIVGILNVTPDSFSDGGSYLDPAAALSHAEEMLAAGADLLDLGAESTRPGRPDPVQAAAEWERLEPVLSQLARRYPKTPLSVDTVKSETAERALDAGAWIVNDVSGLRFDPRIADVCADRGAGLVLMHSRGSFAELATYDHATYSDVIGEVLEELDRSVECARARGVQRDRIIIDPGLGFSKRPEHNLQVLKGMRTIASQGMPVMIGPSRKRFLGAVTGKDVAGRDLATAAVCATAYVDGADLFRVHAVGLVREVMSVVSAIEEA